ncbi:MULTISPECIES: DUF1127 domain-containing protein [Sinorhizobium]|uniref:DUF1127 domain-containing protein n=2 Tax=Sinorhizobium TaxID=28105 RepID=A0A2S3YFW9_9HYPH|nr:MULTISPECIES: DUF1127 domain-containing protein [Sinorhizobium]AUX77718.1 hypothetical protein NXT3_CH03173 [Sinorhizobium fredii]PDT40043.1 DUF1127 domain-containing protein [Sinorhizobium sp. FG01]PDT51531.1 DUF1127 domain-containing protein [Sinorhizobium sp. NG07B]POH25133.1 hypothetical protein ATY31_27480 [Sinorhizobium americanum]POH26495.1 hypothetical protein ATY30_24500 [Sinorhizobium americanum]
MREAQFLVVDTLAPTVDDLCRKFGAWKTARALLIAIWRHRQTTNRVSHLSDRMRRDIGLPENEDRLFEAKFSLWDVRL